MALEEALARKGQDMDTTEGDGFTPRQRFFPTRISLPEPRGSRQSSVETDRQPQKSPNLVMCWHFFSLQCLTWIRPCLAITDLGSGCCYSLQGSSLGRIVKECFPR